MDRQSLPSCTTPARLGFKRRNFHVSNPMHNLFSFPEFLSYSDNACAATTFLARNIGAILDVTHSSLSQHTRRSAVFAPATRNIAAFPVTFPCVIDVLLQKSKKQMPAGFLDSKSGIVLIVMQPSMINGSSINQTNQAEAKCHRTRQDFPLHGEYKNLGFVHPTCAVFLL